MTIHRMRTINESVAIIKEMDEQSAITANCIRTLCKDIGERLGVGGVMKTLERASASGFDLSDSITLSELEELSEGARAARVLSVERIFEKYREIRLPEFFERLASCGLEIYLKKIGVSAELGEIVRLSGARGFFAVGEVREFPDGVAIKPIRQFG